MIALKISNFVSELRKIHFPILFLNSKHIWNLNYMRENIVNNLIFSDMFTHVQAEKRFNKREKQMTVEEILAPFEKGDRFPIVEEFYTIQGEGFHTGKPAYFLRIGGCDVCCSWCDTKVSWDPTIHPVGKLEDIVAKVKSFPAKAVVVTGGEPMLYNLDSLCKTLKELNVELFLETSGSHSFSGNWDWICVSPKKSKPPVQEAYEKADELKIVIDKELDFAWAEEHAAKVDENCKLYLQPEWKKFDRIIAKMVDYIKENPKWNMSLQTHKFMHIP